MRDTAGDPIQAPAMDGPHVGAGPDIVPVHDQHAVTTAASALVAGGIVGLPTETVYGVAVLPRSGPLQALLAAKRRPLDKGIPLLLDDLDQVAGLVIASASARRLAARFWPGPLTLVLPLHDPALVPVELSGGRGSLAVRIPDHAVPRVLARELGPLAVSSANLSGEPEARTAGELATALGDALAVIIDDGPVRGGVPSSVVAVDAHGRVAMLRDGAIARADIESALGIG
jgi:tRNA threonylcarbamoyl adenosine modification protein (Sua5/YciO/YrdC/YwlC family)